MTTRTLFRGRLRFVVRAGGRTFATMSREPLAISTARRLHRDGRPEVEVYRVEPVDWREKEKP